MKEKWRKIGSPQTRSQKRFVSKFFQRLYIYSTYSNYFTYGFNSTSPIPVVIESKKYMYAKDAINSVDKNKYKDEYSLVFDITEKKFNQNKSLKDRLISTGLRPIFFHNKNKYVMCKVLSNLREKFYFELDKEEI